MAAPPVCESACRPAQGWDRGGTKPAGRPLSTDRTTGHVRENGYPEAGPASMPPGLATRPSGLQGTIAALAVPAPAPSRRKRQGRKSTSHPGSPIASRTRPRTLLLHRQGNQAARECAAQGAGSTRERKNNGSVGRGPCPGSVALLTGCNRQPRGPPAVVGPDDQSRQPGMKPCRSRADNRVRPTAGILAAGAGAPRADETRREGRQRMQKRRSAPAAA